MNSFNDELKTAIRRNMLLGMWAAEKLGLVEENAETYAKDLAVGTLDAERSDVFGRIRKDFDLAGIVQSDEQILRVMEAFTLQASATSADGTRRQPRWRSCDAQAQAHVAMRLMELAAVVVRLTQARSAYGTSRPSP